MKRIFDASCMLCLRRNGKPGASPGRRNTTASTPIAPFLVAPSETASAPTAVVSSPRPAPSAGRGVEQPRAVEMEQQPAVVRPSASSRSAAAG